MAQASQFYGDVIFQGGVAFAGTVTLPNSVVSNAQVAAAANIASSKVLHRFSRSKQLYAPGTTIVSLASELLHLARKGGEVVGFEAIITTQATGGDRTVSVDLQKSTAGGAFATILSSPISLTNATVIRTAVAGVISSAAFVDGDIFQAVISVAGAAGAQAAGLLITADFDQNPNT